MTVKNQDVPMVCDNWHRVPIVELHCKAIGAGYRIQKVNLSDLDIDESLKNNARIGDSVLEERVKQYEMNMKNGDVFPFIVLTASMVIVCGVQRAMAAKKAGRRVIWAYILTSATKQQVDAIKFYDNCRHGAGPKYEARLQLAVNYIDQHNITQKDAAELFSITNITDIQTARHAAQIRKTLVRQKVPGASSDKVFKQSHLTALYYFREDETVLKAAAKAIAELHLRTTEADQMISDIKKKRTTHTKLMAIELFKENFNPLDRKKKTAPPKTKLRRAVNDLHSVIMTGDNGKKIESFAQIGLSKKEMDAIKGTFMKIQRQFNKLSKKK